MLICILFVTFKTNNLKVYAHWLPGEVFAVVVVVVFVFIVEVVVVVAIDVVVAALIVVINETIF